ncbi:MAG: hypothetical protein DRQ49_00515 [Gammaproteobacteria bacterium]|nr:MAG: hypothetical protein DRQ41_12330 [Gammaproteobacteria bacterium]RKZ42846.1 MAG: hypothetical protein DRQ49_00515 [Gammaproteobacteria bacterium]RKZ71879.1 MAG: hypothetical protein DRQ57_18095 [Gammaproteobacteria bacterium]
MKNQPQKFINIAAFGMDQRTLKILEMVFNGPGKGDYVLVKDIQSAQAGIFDLDSLDGQNFWKEYQRLYSQLPIIILSLDDKDIAGTVYVKKPIEVDKLIKSLKKLKLLSEEALFSKPVETSPTQVTDKLSQGPRDAKLAMEIAAIEEEEILHQYCGYAQDINPDKFEEIEKVYYEPSHYLQSFFEKAAVVSQQFENGGILIEGLYIPIVLLYQQNKIFCTCQSSDNKLRTMTLLPLSHGHLRMTTLSETELEKYISKHQLLSQPLDNFLWQIALWTARGRVPKGTDLHKPILLLYWPNFTRLIVTPYALKISALWMENPCSLLETSQILAIPQRYVFTFFSAASTLKLAFVDRRLKSRISSRQASDQKPNAKRSLFQRFLARLRA